MTITPQDLKLIAEKHMTECEVELDECSMVYCHPNNDGAYDGYFNPLANKDQAWELMQWYREAISPRVLQFEENGNNSKRWLDAGGRLIWKASESPEALVLACLELIKESES
ncbi:MAG: hypothetical protein R8M45_05070 [Ghiorsea sp.]